MQIKILLSSLAMVGACALDQTALAQFGSAPPAGPPPAEQAAPIDLTGYWESVVTEDWRWRMLTAPKGDFASVPLNPAGRRIAMQFDPSKYGSGWTQKIDCRAYGAAGLMRMPTRMHITWVNPNQLQIQSDWGEQTREIYFRHQDMPQDPPSLQGNSFGQWQIPENVVRGFGRRGGPAPKPPNGKLYVVTGNLAPGWLRRNGVPYGSKTYLTEWFQTFTDPAGKHWFDVTTNVDDPEYLLGPFVTSSDFRLESDGSQWAPHPCVQMQ